MFELQLYFVSLVMLCLLDCRAEGITTLFVFGHVSSRLAMIKSGGSRFQFCADAAIYPRFLDRIGFNSHSVYSLICLKKCWLLSDSMCYLIVLMSSLLFYNVYNSSNKEKPLNE